MPRYAAPTQGSYAPIGQYTGTNGKGAPGTNKRHVQQFAVGSPAPAARQYVLEVDSTYTQYQVNINELRFKIGGTWQTNHGTAAASMVAGSSGYTDGPAGAPWLAMDGNTSTMWDSQQGTPSPASRKQNFWVMVDFGRNVTVEGFEVTSPGDGVHDPKGMRLLANAPADGRLRGVAVDVHYEMYDGIPAM